MKDHLIYFAVDKDDDGFVDRSEGALVDKVRAKVITWCAGADGGHGLHPPVAVAADTGDEADVAERHRRISDPV